MREYIYRHFLTASIYLSNSYSFYFLLDTIIPSRFKYLNIFVFVISFIYAKAIEHFSEIILKRRDKQYLTYSLAKFFINTFVNGVFTFLLMISILFSGLSSNIQFGVPIGLPILSILFFSFLLYAGFFFNFNISFFVFAAKEDYLKNNLYISSSTILFVRFICSLIYLVSFAPFIFILFHFLKSLIGY